MKPLDLEARFDGLDIEDIVVLDLGCGTYATQLSSQMRHLPFKKLISVDIHPPVIKQLLGLKKVLHFAPKEHILSIRDVNKKLGHAPEGEYDVITMFDFIEHLDKEEGRELIKKAQKLAKQRILIWLPLGDAPQDELESEHQTHKATWYKSDLEELGFDVTVYKGFHQHYDPPVDAAWAVWNNKPIKSVLVDRLDVHGDVLVGTSVLPGLRAKYPKARIHWHVRMGYGFALENNPYIDRQIFGPVKDVPELHAKYDKVIVLDHHMRWNAPMAQIHCEQAGVPLHKPELYLTDKEIESVDQIYRDDILVANKAGWTMRMCPNLSLALNELAIDHDFTQLDNGPDLFEGISHPKMSLRQAAAYMYHAKLYIGIDTVFMHMAVAFGVPMVLCMGPTGPESQYIPNATVIKPYEWTNPAKHYPDKYIDLPVENIIRAIKTKLNDDGTIANRRTRLKFVEYTDA